MHIFIIPDLINLKLVNVLVKIYDLKGYVQECTLHSLFALGCPTEQVLFLFSSNVLCFTKVGRNRGVGSWH